MTAQHSASFTTARLWLHYNPAPSSDTSGGHQTAGGRHLSDSGRRLAPCPRLALVNIDVNTYIRRQSALGEQCAGRQSGRHQHKTALSAGVSPSSVSERRVTSLTRYRGHRAPPGHIETGNTPSRASWPASRANGAGRFSSRPAIAARLFVRLHTLTQPRRRRRQRRSPITSWQ